MNNRLCLICGELTATINGVCATCTEDYKKIRSHIETNPLDNIMQISNATNITLKRINQLVDKGKFILIPKDE